MSMFKNERGFSLPEILIATAISGAVALGSLYLFKNQNQVKKEIDQHNNTQSVQKLIESKFYSSAGCDGLKGKSAGQTFDFKVGSENFAVGKSVGGNKITELKIQEFTSYGEDGGSGIAKIKIGFEKVDGKTISTEFPLAVNVSSDGKIEGCNSSLQKITDDLYQRICSGSFGTLSDGKNCLDVLAMVQQMTIKSICEDAYGVPSSVKLTGNSCYLKMIHANKMCATGSAGQSFNAAGGLECIPLPAETPSVCTTWGAWAPDTSSTCTDSTVTQTRSCSSGTGSETRSVSGTKNCPTGCTTWGDWTPALDTICSTKTITQTRTCQVGTGSENRSVKGTKTCPEITWSLCFVAGTQVTLANGRTKDIEKLVLGEKVLTYDEVTGDQLHRPIKEILHHEESFSTLYTFTFINGKTVTSNDIHPFYLPDWGKYMSAESIFHYFQRDPLINFLGEKGERVLIANIQKSSGSVKLYNIHVNGIYDTAKSEGRDNHNYYANGVLVHNVKNGAYGCGDRCRMFGECRFGGAWRCTGTQDEMNQAMACFDQCMADEEMRRSP